MDKKVTLQKQKESGYTSSMGWYMERGCGMTPDGNAMNGRWGLFDTNGQLIDFDQYRNDLAERNNLILLD